MARMRRAHPSLYVTHARHIRSDTPYRARRHFGLRSPAQSMRATPFVLMFWLVLCGCGSQSTSTMTSSPAAVQHGKIIVGGYARTYRLFRPPSLEPKHAAPLVILLHAWGSQI